jgi:hypothetical protein
MLTVSILRRCFIAIAALGLFAALAAQASAAASLFPTRTAPAEFSF